MKIRTQKIIGALGAFAGVAAATSVISRMTATASPPTPLVTKLEDLVRAQTVQGGFFATPPGTDTVASMFALEPASHTGWTTLTGSSVIAVAHGALTLQNAKGCATTQYATGQAAVLPAGRYRIANAGTGPLEFAAMFARLAKGSKTPLVDGAGAGPAACQSTAALRAFEVAIPSMAEFIRGTQVPIAAYGESLHGRNAKGFMIEAGKDILLGSYVGLPGFNSGWVTHQPAFALVKSGRFTYYEARDGGCVKSEEYLAGQAYTHVGGLHMGVNEATEPVELSIAYFNLPPGGLGSMLPAVGHTMDAVDFTPIPPAECPRLN